MSTIKVTNIQHASASTAAIALDSSGQATLNGLNYPTAGPLSNRNLIINGAMQVAQRGTSQSSVSSGVFPVDRFRLAQVGSAVFTIRQSTDVPSGEGFSNSLKLDVTTAATPSASQFVFLETKFEGQDVQHLKKGTSNAESVTLSFWVKSPKTGTHVCNIIDQDNTRHICKSYSVSAANTWEFKTITFEGDTTGAFDNDNGESLRVFWWINAGTDRTSGTLATSWAALNNANSAVGQVNITDNTANDFFLTGVQLEVGSVATPFEHRSYGDELARCQRYHQKMIVQDHLIMCSRWSGDSGVARTDIQLPVTMRSAPTFAFTGTWTSSSGYGGNPVLSTAQPGSVSIQTTVNTVSANNNVILFSSTSNASFDFSAEL